MPHSVPLSSIPTLTSLYKNNILQPSTAPSLPPPSHTLNSKISLIRTSITTLATTSIVNAANESLLGGGGVDGAIHAAAGPSLLLECEHLHGCPTGSAKITSAHDLPCQHIIHAVGPIYYRAKKQSPTKPAELLASCYKEALNLASQKGGSVAFSCLSTGVYGYPASEAAEVALGTVRGWLEDREGRGEGGRLERVVFCVFEGKDERAYGEWLPKIFPPTRDEVQQSQSQPEAQPEQGASKPHASKTNTNTEEDLKDWEAVDKPSSTTSIKPSETETETETDIASEGEKVEAPDLGADEGVKVEKVDELAQSGEVLQKPGLKGGLGGDW